MKRDSLNIIESLLPKILSPLQTYSFQMETDRQPLPFHSFEFKPILRVNCLDSIFFFKAERKPFAITPKLITFGRKELVEPATI